MHIRHLAEGLALVVHASREVETLRPVIWAMCTLVLLALLAILLFVAVRGYRKGREEGHPVRAAARSVGKTCLVLVVVVVVVPTGLTLIQVALSGVFSYFEIQRRNAQFEWLQQLQDQPHGALPAIVAAMLEDPRARRSRDWALLMDELLQVLTRAQPESDAAGRAALAGLPERLRRHAETHGHRRAEQKVEAISGAAAWQIHRPDPLAALDACHTAACRDALTMAMVHWCLRYRSACGVALEGDIGDQVEDRLRDGGVNAYNLSELLRAYPRQPER
ncbi:MAG TPA: hypothetical protein PKZ76_18415 [Xanthomonadaceae bacterium]|nr:hypothetical protein [Xanthomonadaceae bacterium]